MKDFEKEIDKVIIGEISTTKSLTLISPETVDIYLKSIGLEQDEFDSNGWDWDFWMTYSKGDEKFVLAGSGWFNTGLTFSRD